MFALGNSWLEWHESRLRFTFTLFAEPVIDKRIEIVEFYKVNKSKVLKKNDAAESTPPPWISVPPELEVYRQRGHRRLDARTYESKCTACIWGCKMPVEMIIDQWNPSKKRYRFETFCYGPKSCGFYKAGPSVRFQAEKECYILKKIGLMRRQFHIVGWMSKIVADYLQ